MDAISRDYLGRAAYEASMNHIEPGRKEIFGDTWKPMKSWEEQSEEIRERYRVTAEAVLVAADKVMCAHIDGPPLPEVTTVRTEQR